MSDIKIININTTGFDQINPVCQSSTIVDIETQIDGLDLGSDSDSDSDTKLETVSTKKAKHIPKRAKDKQTKLLTESKSVNNESDSESDDDSEKKNTFKTRKALKTEKRNKELQNKSKKNAERAEAAAAASADDFGKSKFPISSFDSFGTNNAFGLVDIPEINIRVTQRNGRKHITKIEGLPNDLFDDEKRIDKMLTELKTKISARACVKISDEGQKYIETSGNRVKVMEEVICDYIKCDSSSIKIHGMV